MKRIWMIIAAIVMVGSPLRAETAAPATSSSGKVVGKPIAIVNNEPIFREEFERESEPFVERFKKTAPEKEQTAEKLSKLRKEILDRLIEERLLLQEAKTQKVRVLKAEVDRGVEQFKEPFAVDEQGQPRSSGQVDKAFQEQLEREGLSRDQFLKRVEEQIMKVKLIEKEVKSKVEMPKDEEVKAFFTKIQDKIAKKTVATASAEEESELTQLAKYLERMTGEQVRVRHIMVRFKPNATASEKAEAKKRIEDIQAKLKAGEDFAFLAKKSSEDPLSRERGGDLGFVAKGDMGLPEMDAAIFKLKEAELSGVVETEIGYHIVKMIERKSPHPLELEDVKDDLRNFMAQRVYAQKLEKYLKSLREKGNVKISSLD